MESFKITISGFETGEYVEVECDGDKLTLSKTTLLEVKITKKSLNEKINVNIIIELPERKCGQKLGL